MPRVEDTTAIHQCVIHKQETSPLKKLGTSLEDSLKGYDDITKSLLKLEEYGYLSGGGSGSASLQSNEAIKKFQTFAHIKVTGKLDKETIAKLQAPRCGMKDPSKPNRAKRYVHQGSKWRKQKLTYKIMQYSLASNPLAPADVKKTIASTLGKWMAVTNLDFVETTSDNADIRISFVRRRHGDPYEFDGRGGTLAHAFYPMNNEGLSGDAHFDDDEHFTLRSASGTNFYWVALHEFGHSIGLEHSNKLGAVMYPWYQGYKGDDPNLQHDDIVGIQSLYGARSKPVATSKPIPNKPDPTQVPQTTPKKQTPKKVEKCFSTIQAILLGGDNRTYVFNEDNVFILSKSLRVEYGPYKISSFFPRGMTKVDAAMKTENGDVVFFYGDKYWIYKGRSLKSGPHPITKYGLHKDMHNLDAALTWRGTSKQYFFKGDRFWRYDAVKGSIDAGYPKSMKAFKGIPNNINAVFQWNNKAIYFFKDEKFYRYDSRQMYSVPGFPLNIKGDFVVCPSDNEVASQRQSQLRADSSDGSKQSKTVHSFAMRPTIPTIYFTILACLVILKLHL
eukprot:gene4809-5439_t